MKAAAVVAFFLVLLLVVPPPPLCGLRAWRGVWAAYRDRRAGKKDTPLPEAGPATHCGIMGVWVQSEIRIRFWFECIDCGCGRLAPCVRHGTDSQSDFCARAFEFWLRHRFPRLDSYEWSFTKATKAKTKGPTAGARFLLVCCVSFLLFLLLRCLGGGTRSFESIRMN